LGIVAQEDQHRDDRTLPDLAEWIDHRRRDVVSEPLSVESVPIGVPRENVQHGTRHGSFVCLAVR
jgi:hypothetical protein